jgi:FK506-binding nuclear protein
MTRLETFSSPSGLIPFSPHLLSSYLLQAEAAAKVADVPATPATESAAEPAAEPASAAAANIPKDEEGSEAINGGTPSKGKLTKRQKKAKAKEATRAAEANGGSGTYKLKSEQQFSGMGEVVKKPVTRHLGGGLKIKDTTLGGGPAPKAGAVVKILYEGLLAASGEAFDSRTNKRSPLSFRLGLREVVPGMDKGLVGMKVGGSREIHVPSNMGYGSKRTGPIPPDSDLVFKVELIGLG